MLDRIKALLNNSVLWLVGLIAAVLYFWKKEKDLEYTISEIKAEGEIKNVEQQIHEADGNAADAVENFERLRREYSELSGRSGGGGKGDPGTKGSN